MGKAEKDRNKDTVKRDVDRHEVKKGEWEGNTEDVNRWGSSIEKVKETLRLMD